MLAPKFLFVADVPDVIANASLLVVRILQRSARDLFFAQSDRFQHRAVARATAADVVDLCGARRPEEDVERADEIPTMQVVADLFAAIPENRVFVSVTRALHELRDEPVKHRTGVIRTRDAAGPETHGLDAEIPSVLLHQQVGRCLRDAEE